MSNMFSTFKSSTSDKKYAIWTPLTYVNSSCIAIQFAMFPKYLEPQTLEPKYRLLFTSVNREGEQVRKWTDWLKVTQVTDNRSNTYKLFNGDTTVLNALMDEDYETLFNMHFKVMVKPNPKNPKFPVITDIIMDHENESAITNFYDLPAYPPFSSVKSYGQLWPLEEMHVRLEDGTAHMVEEAEFKAPENDTEKE